MAICGVGKALYATTDARKYEGYVVNDTPAAPAAPVPPVAQGVSLAVLKQGAPWGALFQFWRYLTRVTLRGAGLPLARHGRRSLPAWLVTSYAALNSRQWWGTSLLNSPRNGRRHLMSLRASIY